MAIKFKGKSMKPGGGGRFAKLKAQLMAKNPKWKEARAEAVAASIGRAKFGKIRFQRMAAKGR